MLKRQSVTLHHIITVYNDIFDHMDGVMRAFTNLEIQWEAGLVLRRELSSTVAVQILS